jgi:hypothetical protein
MVRNIEVETEQQELLLAQVYEELNAISSQITLRHGNNLHLNPPTDSFSCKQKQRFNRDQTQYWFML